jgi:hypothetical protein
VLLAILILLGAPIGARADEFGLEKPGDPPVNFGGKQSDESLDMDAREDARKRRDSLRGLETPRMPDQKLAVPNGGVGNNTPNLNDSFDGSEFNASTFMDTDFSMSSFRDLFGPNDHPPDSDDPTKRDRDHDDHDDRADHRRDPLSMVDRRRKEKEDMDKMAYKRFVKPVYFLPGDWVPSGLDPTWNGGFTTGPDNGSPVPYRLNGHVNLERGLPWQD